jgi:hypothetical protein
MHSPDPFLKREFHLMKRNVAWTLIMLPASLHIKLNAVIKKYKIKPHIHMKLWPNTQHRTDFC